MTDRQKQILRFALSFLMANRDSAFEDYEGDLDPIPTEQELDELAMMAY